MAVRLKLKAQLIADDAIAIGPGKADLLDAIARTGSISAAGRAMGLSYRRAWLMVDAMNRLFAAPLVQTRKGGAGGAQLTEAGQAALAAYRDLQQAMTEGTGPSADRLLAMLRVSD